MGSVDRNLKVDVSKLKRGIRLRFKFKYDVLVGHVIDIEKAKNDKLLRVGCDGFIYNITLKNILEIIDNYGV